MDITVSTFIVAGLLPQRERERERAANIWRRGRTAVRYKSVQQQVQADHRSDVDIASGSRNSVKQGFDAEPQSPQVGKPNDLCGIGVGLTASRRMILGPRVVLALLAVSLSAVQGRVDIANRVEQTTPVVRVGLKKPKPHHIRRMGWSAGRCALRINVSSTTKILTGTSRRTILPLLRRARPARSNLSVDGAAAAPGSFHSRSVTSTERAAVEWEPPVGVSCHTPPPLASARSIRALQLQPQPE